MEKIVKPYTVLTGLYDNLMEYVDYEGWSEYILDIIDEYEIDTNSVLELAAGNYKLYQFLRGNFPLHIVSDLSLNLVKTFHERGDKSVCCDMKSLPFNTKFEFIYCTFDSINYLLTEEELFFAFNEVSKVLKNDGVFTFDASLENNSINNVKELNRKGKYLNYDYSQISEYNVEDKIHTNKFIISNDNENYIEIHRQRVFHFVDYFRILDDAGLRVIDCFDTFTFDNASPDSERAQFIVGKI
ncbi:MAG: hypothetical protein SCALA702_27460 [Melioribacteraceae bacterium]|nr:MAG: hypothetical protein SCALA702_27460 [Melioribacteraceae bacterium]